MPGLQLSCPVCGTPARTVPMSTVARHCVAPPEWEQAWFCAAASCLAVYFSESGEHVNRTDTRTTVFQKGTDPARTVCYCFGHSVADVLRASRPDGGNPLVDEITAACRRGLDRCEEMNPQGRCCLGNVRALVRQTDAPDCCGSD